MKEFLETPIAALVVGIFAIFGVICVVIAIIGKSPRVQLTGKGSLSSFEIAGRKVYALALFGIVLIAGAAALASFSPATEIAKARQEFLSTIAVQETKIAELTNTPQVEQIKVAEQVIVTQIVEVTALPPAIPTLSVFDIGTKNWDKDFCDDRCGQDYGVSASSIIVNVGAGRTHDAIEVLYDLKNSGWVLIKKNLTADLLSKTKGISFFYRGTGMPNSIELKLLLRYPGDTEDTTFGMLWKSATNTSDIWKPLSALYEEDITCWGPIELCEEHGHSLDLEYVHRIEFAISNKAGDTAGLGKAVFTEIVGIP